MNLKIKKNIILLLLIIVAFVGCNKDNFTGHWHIYSHTSDMFDVYDIKGDSLTCRDGTLTYKFEIKKNTIILPFPTLNSGIGDDSFEYELKDDTCKLYQNNKYVGYSVRLNDCSKKIDFLGLKKVSIDLPEISEVLVAYDYYDFYNSPNGWYFFVGNPKEKYKKNKIVPKILINDMVCNFSDIRRYVLSINKSLVHLFFIDKNTTMQYVDSLTYCLQDNNKLAKYNNEPKRKYNKLKIGFIANSKTTNELAIIYKNNKILNDTANFLIELKANDIFLQGKQISINDIEEKIRKEYINNKNKQIALKYTNNTTFQTYISVLSILERLGIE